MNLNNYSSRYSRIYIENFNNQKKNAWMMTFNDLLSLLLIFFILLYSLSEHDIKKLDDFSKGVVTTFGIDNSWHNKNYEQADISYLTKIFVSKVMAKPELKSILIRNVNNKLIISVPNYKIFANNSDHIISEAEDIIYFLSSSLFELKNKISVNSVIALPNLESSIGLSTFLLSILRANSIANILQENGSLPNLSVFILNKDFHKIESEYLSGEYLNHIDRIDIVIHEENDENAN